MATQPATATAPAPAEINVDNVFGSVRGVSESLSESLAASRSKFPKNAGRGSRI
jgi:hypothetical protein